MTFTDLSARFPLGTRVRKKRGSSWRGVVVGEYTNQPHTDQGYAVASLYEPGNVQVYPVAALEAWDVDADPITDPVAADRIEALNAEVARLRGKLEKMQRSRDRYREAWEAEKAHGTERVRAALGDEA